MGMIHGKKGTSEVQALLPHDSEPDIRAISSKIFFLTQQEKIFFLVILKIMSIILFLLAFFQLTSSCTYQWECTAVSDYNFVQCVNGQCQCRTDQGFTGNASVGGCVCDAPRSVFWIDASPYCVDIVADAAAHAHADARIKQVEKVYTYLKYPTPQLILNGTVALTDLFSPNAKGRVDPLGTFQDQTVIEYFYGNAARPLAGVSQVYIEEFSHNDTSNILYVRANIEFAFLGAGGSLFPFANFTQSGHFRFADNHSIISVELINHNVGNISNAALANQTAFILGLCTDIINFCPATYDPAGYYTDFNDCVNFMNHITMGTYDLSAGNTTVCRRLHADLARHDPVIHCVHCGKTGGGHCSNPSYLVTYYQEHY